MELTPQQYYQGVKSLFRETGNPDIAQGQMAYLKNQFAFCGLKMPTWKALADHWMKQHGMPPIGDSLTEVIQLCFADEYRELHYFALELAEKSAKKQAPEWIDVLERLILTQSWWDTVDWIAKLVGIHFKKYPKLTQPVTARWMDSGALWLQRVCLIFQLHYKAQTDAELLFRYVARVADSKEFFLQKGAGWALRQYSRTNPEAVRAFVASHSLAALTRREALRLMDNP